VMAALAPKLNGKSQGQADEVDRLQFAPKPEREALAPSLHSHKRGARTRTHGSLIGTFRPTNGSPFDSFLGYKRIRFSDNR